MDIGFWACITIIVVVESIVGLVRHGIKARALQSARLSEGQYQTLCERFDKMERRMANLETIVLEAEKHKSFDRAL